MSEQASAPVEEQEEEEFGGVDEEALERRSIALSKVVQFGDPILKSRGTPITEFDDDLRADISRMFSLMYDAMGVGLAATQVGLLKRFLVFQSNADAEPSALVNPEIEWLSDQSNTVEEGCLSLSRVVVDVERPLHIRVTGFGQHGEPLLIEASGLEARVLQHEIDHLDGVLMLDRTNRAQRKGALRALRNSESYAPPGSDDDDAEEDGVGEA